MFTPIRFIAILVIAVPPTLSNPLAYVIAPFKVIQTNLLALVVFAATPTLFKLPAIPRLPHESLFQFLLRSSSMIANMKEMDVTPVFWAEFLGVFAATRSLVARMTLKFLPKFEHIAFLK
jgi:hypothetical protein